jgi:DNA-directed RNA polymerase specialized sigma subunit
LFDLDKLTRAHLIEEGDLDDINRQILHLHYIKHKDFGYIADMIGMAPSTVYRRHAEALRILRREMR